MFEFGLGSSLPVVAADALNPVLSRVNEALAIQDAQLLQRIAGKDRAAFSRFYDRYGAVLHAAVWRVLRNPEEAAHVLEEVFLEIWQQAATYDPKLEKPFHWALTLTRRKSVGRLHALNRRYGFVEETPRAADVSHGPPAPNGFPGYEQGSRIRSAVERVPLEERQAIEMTFLGGLTHNQIAEALNQPTATIKARIRRGMFSLRDALKGFYE